MNDKEFELLNQLDHDDWVEWRDIPAEHQTAFGLWARGITVSESPTGGAWVPGRNWRAYLGFLRGTRLSPDRVTEQAIHHWHARRSL